MREHTYIHTLHTNLILIEIVKDLLIYFFWFSKYFLFDWYSIESKRAYIHTYIQYIHTNTNSIVEWLNILQSFSFTNYPFSISFPQSLVSFMVSSRSLWTKVSYRYELHLWTQTLLTYLHFYPLNMFESAVFKQFEFELRVIFSSSVYIDII